MHVSKNPPLAFSISSELADLVTEAEKSFEKPSHHRPLK
jgi:hypothetical protein